MKIFLHLILFIISVSCILALVFWNGKNLPISIAYILGSFSTLTHTLINEIFD